MSELVLRDLDPALLAGIERVAEIHGWSQARAVRTLLERGLHALLGDDARELAPAESDVLRAAISAMEDVPDDSGFALIGRKPGD